MGSISDIVSSTGDLMAETPIAGVLAGLGAMLVGSTRLYRLEGDGALAGLQVEAFVVEESLSQPWRAEIVALHEQVDLDLDAMLAQPATLVTV